MYSKVEGWAKVYPKGPAQRVKLNYTKYKQLAVSMISISSKSRHCNWKWKMWTGHTENLNLEVFNRNNKCCFWHTSIELTT